MADVVIDMTEETKDDASAIRVDAGVVVVPLEDDDDDLPDNAALQPDGSIILTLNFPVTMRWRRAGSDQVREERHETLRMYRLNGAAMRAIMAAGKGHTVPVGIAKSLRMSQAVFDRLYDMMDGSDANGTARVLNFFLEGGDRKATGQLSSP